MNLNVLNNKDKCAKVERRRYIGSWKPIYVQIVQLDFRNFALVPQKGTVKINLWEEE